MNVHAARFMTRALAGGCAVLVLLLLIQYAGFGRGYGWSPDVDGDGAQVRLADIDKRPVTMPSASAFADIEAHPLFNDDRKPTPLDATEAGQAEAPPSPLNIALTGVILDAKNQVRIAMLQDKTRNQAISLRVGMPLEGDQASWTLVEVKPRGAVFRNAANETTEVELETAAAAPVAPRNRPGGKAPGEVPPAKTAAGAKAPNANSDLAQRIEQRRQQMREDAAHLRNGANRPAPPKK